MVDVLIKNKGITANNLVMRMRSEQWQSDIDINMLVVLYTTQSLFKLAINKCKGCIINISYVVAQIENPGQANYAIAKSGVLGLMMINYN